MNGSPSGENRFRRGPDVLRYKVAGNRVTIARFCWKGKAHLDDGTECQDWADIYPPSQTDSETTADTLTIVVADGVSTQPQSGIGARLACDSIGRTLQALREPDKPLPACLADAQADFVAMCLKDRKSGSPENSPASPESTSVVEYATTALVLHLGQSGFWAATVGDGAIYAISEAGQRARTLTELRREGLVNEVRPFTSPKMGDRISCLWSECRATRRCQRVLPDDRWI